MNKKILVVGAGFSGAVVARELAEKIGADVHIVESRVHIAGNAHTERDRVSGVMIHAYGPHIFNTDLQYVWDYVNRFGNFRSFMNRVKACTSRGVYSLPINLLTINQFFGKNFNPGEAREFIQMQADSSIKEPRNFEEQALKFIGRELYETFFKGYTEKQWGCDPRELPASILKRLPVRFNYDDNYYAVRLQGMPENGYSSVISNMLDHKNISVSLNTCYHSGMEKGFDHVFYTGPIDAFFKFCDGRLRYRTVTFERVDSEGDFQGNPVINYPGREFLYTRIHEHKHFAPWENHSRTVAFREYSKETLAHDTPYYPLRLEPDIELLDRYKTMAAGLENVTFLGRLATYQYLDMDDVIDEALISSFNFITNRR